MKRFILRVLLFFGIIVVMDFLSGYLFALLLERAKGGNNGRNNYICDKTKADVLIFGSSRAFHHYNPIIIEDSLGLSCYNCGQDGNGSILNYGRYQLICQRYHPRLLIYDVTPSYDVLTGEDNHRFLGWLRAYYDRRGIPEIFESVDVTETYKMQSNLYRYNSKFLMLISDAVHPMKSEGIQGFRPIDKEMDTLKIYKDSEKQVNFEFDTLKIAYINKMIELSEEKTKLIFVVSPIWYGMNNAELQPIISICEQRGIPFWNYANDSKYVHNNRYFADGGHMNSRGADEFTKDLVSQIKHEMNTYGVVKW